MTLLLATMFVSAVGLDIAQAIAQHAELVSIARGIARVSATAIVADASGADGTNSNLAQAAGNAMIARWNGINGLTGGVSVAGRTVKVQIAYEWHPVAFSGYITFPLSGSFQFTPTSGDTG